MSSFFEKKTDDHLLGSASSNFCWICLVFETPIQSTGVYYRAHTRVFETPIQPTAVYFQAHKHKSTIYHLSRCHRRVSKHRDRIFEAFLSTNRHKPLFERLTNCVGSKREQIFLTVKCSSNIECMAGPTNA